MKVVKNYRFGNHENKSLKELEKLSEDFNNKNRKNARFNEEQKKKE